MKLTSRISTHYRVAINGNSWLAESDYSQYYKRLNLREAGKIQSHEVYGPDQAAEHVEEYFNKIDQYTYDRQKDVLTIEEVITIVTPVKTVERPKFKDSDLAILQFQDHQTRNLLIRLMALRDKGSALATDAIYDIVHNKGKNVALSFPQRDTFAPIYFNDAVITIYGETVK